MISWLKERLLDNFRTYVATAVVVALVAAAVVLIRGALAARVYDSYRVEKEALKHATIEDSVNVFRYEYADGFVLSYTRDGASLLNKDLEKIWSVAYTMSDPAVDVCGGKVLIYDVQGTSLYICNEKTVVSSFSTELPILSARVSAKNTAAVLLRDGEKVDLVYYTKDGTRIAAGESSMTDPGYPISLSLSEDGYLLAVSYLVVSEGTTNSRVRIYNFGAGGRNKADNLVGEFFYQGVFAPEVRYLSGSRCAVFRDDGFSVIEGKTDPKEICSEVFSTEICSAFSNGSVIGIVTRSDVRDYRYMMSVYSANGRQMSRCPVDLSYERVRACGGDVIFSGRTEFAIFSTEGRCRFAGKLNEGNITDTLKIGRNRYLILTDTKMEVISLQ